MLVSCERGPWPHGGGSEGGGGGVGPSHRPPGPGFDTLTWIGSLLHELAQKSTAFSVTGVRESGCWPESGLRGSHQPQAAGGNIMLENLTCRSALLTKFR